MDTARVDAERELASLAEVVCATGLPGVAIAVGAGGEITAAAAGTDGIEADAAPLDPDARFRFGSVGKTVLATVALGLVSAGGVSLDDRVGALWENGSPFADRTLRELLNHTSGIPDYMRQPEYIASLTRAA